MDISLTFGDVLWDISIAMTSIILIKIAFYERFKGKIAFFLYVLLCLEYIFADYMVLMGANHDKWIFINFTALIMELFALFLTALMAEGDIWRNITFVTLNQIIVGMLLGVVSIFSKSIYEVLCNDGFYRVKNCPLKFYLYISILQILFAILTSYCMKPLVRRFTKFNSIIYKFFFAFYMVYGFFICVIRVKNYVNHNLLELYFFVGLQFMTVLFCIYVMIYIYNKSVINNIKKELEKIDLNNERFVEQYKKIAEENIKLSEIKVEAESYIKEISKSQDNKLKLYADLLNKSKEGFEIRTNPIVGNLLIDCIISNLESKLKENSTVLELTVGRGCDVLIRKHENEIAFVLKSIINIFDIIKDNSYVVIGLRNEASKIFISVNMVCKSKLRVNKILSKLMNYIRLQKGYCVIKSLEEYAVINILI